MFDKDDFDSEGVDFDELRDEVQNNLDKREKEVRLSEVFESNTKKPINTRSIMKRSSTMISPQGSFIPQNSLKKAKETQPLLEEEEEEEEDQSSNEANIDDMEMKERKKSKTSSRYSKSTKRSKSLMMTEMSETQILQNKYPKIMKFRNSKWYQIAYFT